MTFAYYSNIQLVVTLGNVVLLLGLLYIYLQNYRKLKSRFSLGLMMFAVVLLLQALTSTPVIHSVIRYLGHGTEILAVLADLFEFVALAVLLYISYK